MESNARFPELIDAGDSGLMVNFGDTLTEPINNAAHAFDSELRKQDWPGVSELIPSIRGVLVRHDPIQLPRNQLRSKLETVLASRDWLQTGPNPERKRWILPAYYGGDAGPDLASVANQMGLDETEVIAQHSQTLTRVLMLGFAPGCAYLGSLPENWDLPRLDYVKPEVPPGSLSVAVRQTVLFATTIPTGWQTIGRTPFLSFSKNQPPYFHLSPGDELLFDPIDERLFETLYQDSLSGKMIVSPEPAE
ncbi:MAG: allophanate hydrolase subunit 1 [Granulosicoccus sp.]|nr:allophanate hydrolase subunit 1 [Granulosicoccus sp.]